MERKKIKKNKKVNKLMQFLSTTAEGQSYAVAITTVVLVILVLVIGVIPAINATIVQYTDNQEKQETLNKVEEKLEKLRTLSFEYGQNQEVVDVFNSSFRERIDEEIVVSLVDQYINRNQLFFGSMSFSELESNRDIKGTIKGVDPKVKGAYLSLRVEGRKENISNFISDLENNLYIFDIKSISFTSVKETNVFDLADGREFIANMQMIIYYWDK